MLIALPQLDNWHQTVIGSEASYTRWKAVDR